MRRGDGIRLAGAAVAAAAALAASPTTLSAVGPARAGEVTTATTTAAGEVRAAAVTRDPVLAAAGDIACDPLSSTFNRGRGSTTSCRQRAVSRAILADPRIKAVAALGDVQYYCGGLAAFRASYDPTWGRFKAITHPAVGNHEYLTGGESATDCDPTGTAKGYYRYFGAAAGRPDQGYYSYELGRWHVVVLNTTCSMAGGCGTGSPQETWLRADLAAHPARCTLAYWHIPLWSSGGRAAENSAAFVRDLYDAHADVVLTGHDHIYERFAAQDPSGHLDRHGLRAFVVGTGGANHTEVEIAKMPHSRTRNGWTFGYLRLVLHPRGYRWRFVPVGGTYTDHGTARCR